MLSHATRAASGADHSLGELPASRAQPYTPPPVNASWKGWCLRALMCPLHMVTHAPNGSVVGTDDAPLPLGCVLPQAGPLSGLASMRPRLAGGFAVPSMAPQLYALVSQRLAATPSAVRGVCSYAEDWARWSHERACHAHPACAQGGGASVTTRLAVPRVNVHGTRTLVPCAGPGDAVADKEGRINRAD